MPSPNSTDEPATNVANKIKALQRSLAKKTGTEVVESGAFGDDTTGKDTTRTAIAVLRKRLNPNDPTAANTSAPANRQLDKKLNAQIFE